MLSGYLASRGHSVVVVTRSVQRRRTLPHDQFFFVEPESGKSVAPDNVCVLRHNRPESTLLWFSCKLLRPSLAMRKISIALYNRVYSGKCLRAFAGVDIVHHIGQGVEMLGFAAHKAAEEMECPFVVQPTLHPGQWGDSVIDKELYSRAQRLLVHSDYEKRYCRELGMDAPISIVGNGISDRMHGNAARFMGKYRIRGKIIVFIGRRDSDKGFRLVLDAFVRARETLNDITLVVMGPGGSEVCPMPVGAIDLGFANEEAKHDALAACSLLCVPSEGESFGLVFMEAARYSKPSVARDLPILEELFGRDGIMLVGRRSIGSQRHVELGVAELASCFVSVLMDNKFLEEVGRRARTRSDAFLWNVVGRRFEGAYEETLHKFGRV